MYLEKLHEAHDRPTLQTDLAYMLVQIQIGLSQDNYLERALGTYISNTYSQIKQFTLNTQRTEPL